MDNSHGMLLKDFLTSSLVTRGTVAVILTPKSWGFRKFEKKPRQKLYKKEITEAQKDLITALKNPPNGWTTKEIEGVDLTVLFSYARYLEEST